MTVLLQTKARNAWTTPYAFESTVGLLGVSLSATTSSGTSSRTALVGQGNGLILTNTSAVVICVALGDSNVTATASYLPILPLTQVDVSLPPDDTVTHVAAVSLSSSGVLLVHRGYGI